MVNMDPGGEKAKSLRGKSLVSTQDRNQWARMLICWTDPFNFQFFVTWVFYTNMPKHLLFKASLFTDH